MIVAVFNTETIGARHHNGLRCLYLSERRCLALINGGSGQVEVEAIIPGELAGTAQAETAAPAADAAKTWYPKTLDLTSLRQNEAQSNPYGADFNYAAEFAKLDLDAVKADIRKAAGCDLANPFGKDGCAEVPPQRK